MTAVSWMVLGLAPLVLSVIRNLIKMWLDRECDEIMTCTEHEQIFVVGSRNDCFMYPKREKSLLPSWPQRCVRWYNLTLGRSVCAPVQIRGWEFSCGNYCGFVIKAEHIKSSCLFSDKFLNVISCFPPSRGASYVLTWVCAGDVGDAGEPEELSVPVWLQHWATKSWQSWNASRGNG